MEVVVSGVAVGGGLADVVELVVAFTVGWIAAGEVAGDVVVVGGMAVVTCAVVGGDCLVVVVKVEDSVGAFAAGASEATNEGDACARSVVVVSVV